MTWVAEKTADPSHLFPGKVMGLLLTHAWQKAWQGTQLNVSGGRSSDSDDLEGACLLLSLPPLPLGSRLHFRLHPPGLLVLVLAETVPAWDDFLSRSLTLFSLLFLSVCSSTSDSGLSLVWLQSSRLLYNFINPFESLLSRAPAYWVYNPELTAFT